jgi:hypothetical protein
MGWFRKKPGDLLDQYLFRWDQENICRVRDFLNGGICIMGATGSAKTSSSGRVIAESLIAQPGSGGLIVPGKSNDVAMWKGWFAKHRREKDLLVFGAEGHYRFNPLDYEFRHGGGSTRNLTKLLTTIGEALKSGENGGADSHSKYWEAQQERMLHNGIEVVKLATGTVDPWDLQCFITGMANSPAQVQDADWQKGFHFQALWKAYNAPKQGHQQHDYDLARQYWLGEIPAMNDRTKSSITAGVLQILHLLNTGLARELLSSTTNLSPDDIFKGIWVLVNFCPAEWGEVGKFISGVWKYLVQMAVLRRPNGNLVTVWVDEADQHKTSFDHIFAQQSRSHTGASVLIVQSLGSFYSASPGDAGKAQTEALLANFTKVFHALGDYQTAEWAANLIGKERTTFIGGSNAPAQSVYDQLFGESTFSGSFSEHYEFILQPNEFQNGLRMGGPANNYLADAIVVKSGTPFVNGRNFLHVVFSQK